MSENFKIFLKIFRHFLFIRPYMYRKAKTQRTSGNAF